MKIGIGCTASFTLNLDKATVDALHAEAAKHYDGTCKGLARPEGMLTKWQAMHNAGWIDTPTYGHTVTFRELDLLCKVAECSRNELVLSFGWAGMKAMRYWNENYQTFNAGEVESK